MEFFLRTFSSFTVDRKMRDIHTVRLHKPDLVLWFLNRRLQTLLQASNFLSRHFKQLCCHQMFFLSRDLLLLWLGKLKTQQNKRHSRVLKRLAGLDTPPLLACTVEWHTWRQLIKIKKLSNELCRTAMVWSWPADITACNSVPSIATRDFGNNVWREQRRTIANTPE